jgi:hypothetical protein
LAQTINPTKDYLQQFSSPLWDLLDLDDCKPLTIIEGHRGTLPFVVIDMQHAAYGPLSDNGKTAISTFFIVRHLKKLSNAVITQVPPGYQVSADSDCVYLVAPSKKIRPGQWESMLEKTLAMAASVSDRVAVSATQTTVRRTYTPVGAGLFINAFWFLVCLLFGVLFIIYGLGGILGMTSLSESRSESVLLGWQLLLLSAGSFFGAFLYYKKIKKRL